MKVKTDLFTSIIAAIAGVLIAFFVTNLFIGPIEDVTYKKVSSSVNASIADPDPEVFNYKALNPTVEVYVGECVEYNQYGECVEVSTNVEDEVVEEVEVEENVEEETENNQADQSTETPEQENE
ncbi:hypothetical protein IKF43_02170 [Candidatus Saccharibacteria bacterium]|nr:hypothetical protein [Candidatus Saccharibacteria bacterium]